MRCYCPTTTDVYFNLATEEYLLKHSTEDIFMLWQSDRAVVVGKNQDVETEADLQLAENKNIRIARRFSGGGAVYQDLGNFNLTFIETTDTIDFNRYINRVIAFLSTIGIRALPDERLGITVNGMKVSGSAQSIHKNRVLYHCTLLFSTDLNILKASLNGNAAIPALLPGSHIRAVPSVRSKVTNISLEMRAPSSLKQFKGLILKYFLEESNNNSLFFLTPEMHAAIQTLRNEKYILPAWIMLRKDYRRTTG